MSNSSRHGPSGNHPTLAGAGARGTTPTTAGANSPEGGTEHGVRGRAGTAGLVGSATTPPHATRYIETTLGVLSYAELAPHLADRVAAVEQSIATEGYASDDLDEYLILRLHGDIVSDLVPEIGGRWRNVEVSVGAHTPPPPSQVPVAMREYARDLAARMAVLSQGDDKQLIELLAFAEGRLLSIHPFRDFNGRATRAFLAELLRRLNLPAIDPTPATGAATNRYLTALSAADRLDWRPLMQIWRQRFSQDIEPRYDVCLPGCAPTPLASYLKALGVLRLVAKEDVAAQGWWQGERFWIRSRFDQDALLEYFLHRYEPTPVLAPWNGGSGFYEKDNKTALNAIQESTSSRLALYRDCLRVAEQSLVNMDRSSSPKDSAKVLLLNRLRGTLPDTALDWFDASVLLSGEVAQYPPLLGTGGNDGRLDFTNNFMQRLREVLDLTGETLPPDSRSWLTMALYGQAAPGLVKKAIGQFSPGRVGGPNASTGFEADSTINPWDFVLMIEGVLPFAAAAVRRNADDPAGVLSYPFTVRAVGAGSGSLGEGDAASARGELWMPLWRQPATHSEVRALLAEGRVAMGRKPARDALDFVRAVHHLGSYRGIDSFQRYGLLMRSGKAYLATPLARIHVGEHPDSGWLDDLDRNDWLSRFRRFAQGENVSKRLLILRRRLEDSLFDLSGDMASPIEVQTLLILLGEIQAALSNSSKAQESVPPVPRLPEHWVQKANDHTHAFRIACALAGLSGTQNAPLPLRAQLFPLHPKYNTWMDAEREAKTAINDPACRIRIWTPTGGNLPDMLVGLLVRRMRLAEQFEAQDRSGMPDKLLHSRAGADLDDMLAFLDSDNLDQRIAALLPALSLCDIPRDSDHTAGGGVAPAAFALLKLCLTSDGTLRALGQLNERQHVSTPPSLLAQLAAGTASNQTVRNAWRALRVAGLSPLFAANALPELGRLDSRRIAAALLIPLRFGATAVLANSVLKTTETETT